MLVVDQDTKDPDRSAGTVADANAEVLLDDSATVADVERAQHDGADLARRGWAATWPKLAAVALALFLWQCVVWSGWRPEYALPGAARRVPAARRDDRRRHRVPGPRHHDGAGRRTASGWRWPSAC